MSKQSPGRVGVAPSRERCPICNKRVELYETSDAQHLCHVCWETYELALAEEAAGWTERGMPAITTKASKGRTAVAPSRERCPVCGDRAALHQTRDDNQMCQPCLERYEAFCDREAAGFLHDAERGPATEIAPVPDMPDALAPWYRAIARWALDDTRQS